MEKEWVPRTEGLNFVEIFKERGIAEEDIPLFMKPREFTTEVVHYSMIHNMKKAVDLAVSHIQNEDNVLVIADVDTDGVTSGAIVYNALRMCGTVDFEDKIDIIVGEGKHHGVAQHLQNIIGKYDLIIACDSGSNEYDVYQKLHEQGSDIILLDHHGADHETEHAVVVNTEMYPLEKSQLSGAGVCLKFVEGLSEFYDVAIPYDLAAVGIIADMMDMRCEDNRAICVDGFCQLRNNGIKAALQGYEFNSTSVRFSIAPLVNAAQRMGENKLALDLFLNTTAPERCEEIVKLLKECKIEQKERVEEALMRAVIKDKGKYIVATLKHNEKSEGLSGLIATRISKDDQKSVVFLQDAGDEWRGSIRAYGVPNLKTLINETGLATSEGHEEAAGIAINKRNLNDFLLSLGKALPTTQRQTIIVDAELNGVCDLTLADVAVIDEINEVTGEGFEPITVMISGVKPDGIFAMGRKHTRIQCGDVVLLKWNDTKPVQDWGRNKWRSFDIIGEPTLSRYRGKEEINIIIKEIDYEVTA